MVELFAGRYALGRLLGAGGSAKVYDARDQRLDRRVAVKLVPAVNAEPVARQRFVREARSAAAFNHPNAVALYDAGEAEGSLYLVMEVVDGESLAERLAAHGPLDPVEADRIITGVLAALSAAHAAGIVHRDVKPGNVLLGSDGAVKLADFGIAKRLDDAAGDVTVIGDIVGTPKYLAPELVDGAPATPESDVYAAGVVLFEMLAGRPPYDAATPLATALAHRFEPVPDVAALRPGLPPRLADVVRTAMAKGPDRRYPSAAAMLAALSGRGAAHPTAPLATATTGAAGATPLPPTDVFSASAYRPSRMSPWWAALVVGLLAGAAALTFLVVDGDDSGTTASSAPASPLPTAGPTTVVAAVAPTTVAATLPPPTDTSTIEGIIATIEANPEAYGPKAEDIVKELGKIRDNGGNTERRAAEILDKAAEWVEKGELDAAVLAMLEPVLGPIAVDADDDDEDDDDD